MAQKAKKEDQSLEKSLSILFHTEENFAKMLLAGHSRNKIKLTQKQIRTLQGFSAVIATKPNMMILHDSANTHAKLFNLISTGMTQSPMMQQQKSSERINQVMRQVSVTVALIKAQARIDGVDEPDVMAYMLTLTRPNTHKDMLNKDYTKHRGRVTKLMKRLANGARRGNGLQLTGANYCGAYVSHEVTVNKEKLKNKQSHKLYHPHSHVIVFSDGKLDVEDTKKELLANWRAINSDLSLSAEAFDFKAVYDPKAPNSSNLSLSAMSEAVKYSVKPDTWYDLSNTSDSYAVEVFSELYNSVKGKKLKQSHGSMEKAMNFINTFKSFESAMGNSLMTEMPDLVTQISDLVYDWAVGKLGQYKALHRREMTPAEIIYYNRGFIEEAFVNAELEDEIERFFYNYYDSITDKNMKLYAETFKSITLKKLGDEMFEEFERYAVIAENQKDDLKAYDIRLFSDALKGDLMVDENGELFNELPFFVEGEAKSNDIQSYGYIYHIDLPEIDLNKDAKNNYKTFKKLHSQVSNTVGQSMFSNGQEITKEFLKTQGITSSIYDFRHGQNYQFNLNVDMKLSEVEDYFGEIFFGNNWKNIKI